MPLQLWTLFQTDTEINGINAINAVSKKGECQMLESTLFGSNEIIERPATESESMELDESFKEMSAMLDALEQQIDEDRLRKLRKSLELQHSSIQELIEQRRQVTRNDLEQLDRIAVKSLELMPAIYTPPA